MTGGHSLSVIRGHTCRDLRGFHATRGRNISGGHTLFGAHMTGSYSVYGAHGTGSYGLLGGHVTGSHDLPSVPGLEDGILVQFTTNLPLEQLKDLQLLDAEHESNPDLDVREGSTSTRCRTIEPIMCTYLLKNLHRWGTEKGTEQRPISIPFIPRVKANAFLINCNFLYKNYTSHGEMGPVQDFNLEDNFRHIVAELSVRFCSSSISRKLTQS